MADEPSFPSPDAAKRKNADVKVTPSEPRAAIVVQRAEPLPESRPPEKAKLTPDEVRALLAVNEVNRPKEAMKRRGRTVLVPTIILSVVSHLFIAYWYVAVALLVVAAVVWTIAPWKKPDEW